MWEVHSCTGIYYWTKLTETSHGHDATMAAILDADRSIDRAPKTSLPYRPKPACGTYFPLLIRSFEQWDNCKLTLYLHETVVFPTQFCKGKIGCTKSSKYNLPGK